MILNIFIEEIDHRVTCSFTENQKSITLCLSVIPIATGLCESLRNKID
jgi:hypothetical protein